MLFRSTRDRRPLQNGERQSGYRSVSFSAFSQFTDRLLLHIPATFRRRGIPVPRLRGVNRLCSSNIAEMRICGYRAEEKILCRSPFFAAVTCRQSAPDPPRERGDSQEGGNRRCLPSCAPARRQRSCRGTTAAILPAKFWLPFPLRRIPL